LDRADKQRFKFEITFTVCLKHFQKLRLCITRW